MKKIMITLVLVSSLSCLFSSCSKLPVYQSTAMTSVDDNFLTQEGIMRYYDVDNKLEYGFGNDSENLFVRIETTDAMSSSMGGGMSGGRSSGGGMPGGSGGRPGGGGRSMGGGSRAGGGEMMQRMQQMQQPIDLWCSIILQ